MSKASPAAEFRCHTRRSGASSWPASRGLPERLSASGALAEPRIPHSRSAAYPIRPTAARTTPAPREFIARERAVARNAPLTPPHPTPLPGVPSRTCWASAARPVALTPRLVRMSSRTTVESSPSGGAGRSRRRPAWNSTTGNAKATTPTSWSASSENSAPAGPSQFDTVASVAGPEEQDRVRGRVGDEREQGGGGGGEERDGADLSAAERLPKRWKGQCRCLRRPGSTNRTGGTAPGRANERPSAARGVRLRRQ